MDNKDLGIFSVSIILGMNAKEKCQKNAENFMCNNCNFKCCKKSNYNKHLQTDKHKFLTNPNSSKEQNAATSKLGCICGKTYRHMSSLCFHKKNCSILNNDNNYSEKKYMNIQTDDDVKDLILEVINDNKQLHKIILEMIPKIGNNSIINNTNSHNKTFNLNLFLNETCKDAMNIMEFANSLKIKLSDLENVGKLGYIDGITNIIVKNLKELDVTKRPVHCSDFKREILYVKDENKWTKEKETLKDAIKHIAHKNIQMIPEWKKENPEYKRDEGKANDEYLKIVMESMGGSDKQEDEVYQNKIISKLSKYVIIEKDITILEK